MMSIRAAGDAALLVEAGDPQATDDNAGNDAGKLAVAIRTAALPGILDVVPGAATVLVSYEPGSWDAVSLAGRLREVASAPPVPPPDPSTHDLVVPVVYDGPDLADTAALTGLSDIEVIARHAWSRYRVGWLGFSPGFGYLTGLDPALAAVPRLETPRVSVPAGSVAIAGGFAGVYPTASPGGWRLLGRTSAVLWEPGRDPPALLWPGRHVRFRIVDRLPPPSPVSDLVPSVLGDRVIEVLQPGPLATIQDLGRVGFAHLGVPGSGAADAGSLRRANRLVGNHDASAGLEVTLGKLVIGFEADAVVAVTGAPVPMSLEAAPGGAEPGHEASFAVPAGSVLKLGSPRAGLRSYLAVDGGIAVPPVLGSRSTDRLSGLGPALLRTGDRLPLGPPRSRPDVPQRGQPGALRPPAPIPPAAVPPAAMPPAAMPSGSAEPVRLRAIAGPRDDWFADAALDALAGGGYQVTTDSDRTGLRLAGPTLRRAPGRSGELASEGIAAGSLQVPHDGQPILLLADHPVTGGYPVIAVVVTADLGLAAQLRPGQRITFAVRHTDLR